MKKWIKNILFKIELIYWKWVIKRFSENMFSFPILLSMEFNVDYYRKRYMNGISFSDIILKKTAILDSSMKRQLDRISNKPSKEVYIRYYNIKSIRNNRLEIEEHYKKNPGLKEEIEKLMNE